MVKRESLKVTARVVDEKIERVVTEVHPVVELTIPMEDALILQRVLYNISGDPGGPRGAMNRISDALDAVGVRGHAPGVDIRKTMHIEVVGHRVL